MPFGMAFLLFLTAGWRVCKYVFPFGAGRGQSSAEERAKRRPLPDGMRADLCRSFSERLTEQCCRRLGETVFLGGGRLSEEDGARGLCFFR